MLRRQLPVSSPVSVQALLTGLFGALGASAANEVVARVKAHYSAREVLLTDSGTSALALAMAGASTGRNPLIALPAYGCYDLATAVCGSDTRAVLYDLDPLTLAPEPKSLEAALARGPSALVAVHLYGIPVDVEQLKSVAAAAGTVVLEDAAQAIGALAHGAPCGSFGSVAILSFGRGKGISAGSGGALLANDEAGMALVRQIRGHMRAGRAGWREFTQSSAQWLFGRAPVYGAIAAIPFLRLGETIYRPPHEPRGVSRAATRILANVWERAHANSEVRRARAARLRSAVNTASQWRAIQAHPGVTPGYLRFPLLAKHGWRSVFRSPLPLKLGVARGYPMPLSQLHGFRERCVNAHERFPGAELLAEQLITLPTHDMLTAADIDNLELWLKEDISGQVFATHSAALAV